MSELAARAEVGRLASELDIDRADLDFLLGRDSDDLRRLRRGLSAGLDAPHRATFAGMARASKLLPVALLGPIAERALGALACSKIAAELDPGHARKIVGQFSTPFLADLCRTLDPVAAGDVIRAIPAPTAVVVGRALYERRDHETLARFIDAVNDDVFEPMLAVVDDEGFLLRVAVAAESRSRLNRIFSLLDDARIESLLHAGAASDALGDAVVLLGDLGPTEAGRILKVAVDAGPLLLDDLVAAVTAVGGWDEVLPLVAAFDRAVLTTLASSPAIRRPDLFRSVAEDVLAHGLGPDLVALISVMHDEVQRDVATTLARSAPEIASALVELVAEVPGARDLPAVAALHAAT